MESANGASNNNQSAPSGWPMVNPDLSIYRALAANIPSAAVFIIDGELRYRLAEGQALQDAGLTSADLEGKTIFEALEPALVRLYEPYFRQALAGHAFQVEHHSHDRDYISRGTPLLTSAGDVYALMAVSYDITERRQHERWQAFLLNLSDALRTLRDPIAIQEAVTRITLNDFKADRCYYCEIIEDQAIIRRDASRGDVPSVVGAYPLTDMPIFKAVVDMGRPVVVPNVFATDMLDEPLKQLCIQLQIISFLDVPVIRDGQPVGMLCIVQGAARQWTGDEVNLAVEIAERTSEAVQRARAEAAIREMNDQLEQRVTDRTQALQKSHEQLQELSIHMETTREDERTRIAREVHDELGGNLTALKIELGALAWGRESDEQLIEHINGLKAHLDEIVQIVRRIGSDLRPPVLDDYGLIPALEWHARMFEQRTGIAMHLDLIDQEPYLDRAKRTAVFRVVQEALTNVARHAAATQVHVTMGVDENELVLVIEDDGIGIKPEQLNFAQSLGLRGMEERMKEVGGAVEIEGEVDAGTVVAICVPIHNA
jgi:signal transduction histidine kinase